MGKKRNTEKISYKILSSARCQLKKPVGEILGRGQEIQPTICTPRKIVVIFKKIEYSDNNKMNSVKTKKTDDKILNLEKQRKI